MSYLHVPIPREELDAFHGVARARGFSVKEATRQAMKLWLETAPGTLSRGLRKKLAQRKPVQSEERNDPYAPTPEAAATFDAFIEKVTAYQEAQKGVTSGDTLPIIDVPGEPVDEVTDLLNQMAQSGEF